MKCRIARGIANAAVLFLLLLGIVPDGGFADETPRELAIFRDCPQCPELVVVPGSHGPTKIGSPEDEAGRIGNETETAIEVTSFAMGRFEVTVAEYLACVDGNGCAEPEWRDPKSPHHITQGTSRYYRNLGSAITDPKQPITGVSHNDAVAYAAWLSSKTGKKYRLPSEAEWEYAARAGAAGAYWWGSGVVGDNGEPMAHCRGCGSGFDGKGAAPVDSLKPNPWGFYNTLGNVWEWVADYYCEDNSDRPKDGSARRADDCRLKDADGLRVLRGGSSFYDADKARAASRLRNYSSFRNFSVGFRIARDLDKR